MAITDDLKIDFKAASGQTGITDLINGDIIGPGTGTLSLQSDADGHYWRLTGGSAVGSLAADRAVFVDYSTTKTSVIVYKIRLSSRADNYTRFIIIGDDDANGFVVSNGGVSTGQIRAASILLGGTSYAAVGADCTNGSIITIVQRAALSPTVTDKNDVWIGGATHTSGTPDLTWSGSVPSSAKAFNFAQFLTTTETLDVYRVCVLSGTTVDSLTNDQLAALADDVDGTLSPSATTHEITISNSVQANTVSDVAIDNTVAGTHNITVSSSQQVNTVSSVAIQQTVPGSGTITTPEVRDWETRNLKTGLTGVQVDVRSIETGALIVRKTGLTTHATTAVCTITDAAIPNVTLCEVMMRCPDGSKGVWDLMSV